ncbi:glycosyltransferase [Candidatus Woesearchaeota archaeon]|nr:glycosyltransferase [Candidatus Woesearchaeota archaeon]
MPNYSVVRFGDSVNNSINGPSVANWNLLTKQQELGILGDTHLITYTQKEKTERYPSGLKVHEVDLKQSKEISARMPYQPHFKTVEKALEILPKLKNKVIAVAVSGRYSPQAQQFVSLVNKNTKKKAYLVVEGHGSDVCGYQLREFEALYRNIYKAADLVVLQESPIAKYYFEKEKFSTKNMAVCPTVVSWEDAIDKLKKNPGLIKDVRDKYYKSYNIPKGAEFILTIGRFQPEKGHRYLVMAAKKILREYPDLYFLLGGSGDGTISELRRIIGDEKRIKIIGKVPFSDFYALIASSKAFVIPSLEIWKKNRLYFAETGPRTLVDGLAAGIVGKNVVIASDSGGTSFNFNLDKWLMKCFRLGSKTPKKPDYKNIFGNSRVKVYNANNRGLLVEQKNPESIVQAIRLIMDDNELSKTLNQEGSRYVTEWRSSRKIAGIYDKIIKSVV